MQTDDSSHQGWRDRAREIRVLGGQMHDRVARDEMLRLADKYERKPRRAYRLNACNAASPISTIEWIR